MRQTLLFGALESLLFNRNRQNPDQHFYESGTVYRLDSSGSGLLNGYAESSKLSILISGKHEPESWNTDGRRSAFYDLQHVVTNIFSLLSPDKAGIIQQSAMPDYFEYGVSYSWSGKTLGQAGKLNRPTLRVFDISDDVFYAELDWDALLQLSAGSHVRYSELPRFPEVRRDLALVVGKSISFSQLDTLARDTAGALLKRVNLFDVYEGEKIGAGKKSYALSFILQDESKTLTDKEIDAVMQQLVQVFSEKFGASLR
jgi:phenylalanyl-tRNA synthetase beta chain